jgi:hypothetical protein
MALKSALVKERAIGLTGSDEHDAAAEAHLERPTTLRFISVLHGLLRISGQKKMNPWRCV